MPLLFAGLNEAEAYSLPQAARNQLSGGGFHQHRGLERIVRTTLTLSTASISLFWYCHLYPFLGLLNAGAIRLTELFDRHTHYEFLPNEWYEVNGVFLDRPLIGSRLGNEFAR